MLLDAAGKIVPGEELFERVLQRRYSVLDRSIDNHVSGLRKKLGCKIGEVDAVVSTFVIRCGTSTEQTVLKRTLKPTHSVERFTP
jgi:DNA-binding winged helix-turn-helix (wHTH) protein